MRTHYTIRYLAAVLLALFALLSFEAQAKNPIRTEYGVVKKVSDGDTIQAITDNGTKLKIRLYGIDAPETAKGKKKTITTKPGQPYGEEAQESLENKVMGKKVRIDIVDVDRYHRLVSLIYLSDRNINHEMVAEGYAWAYRQYLDSAYASEFIGLEDEARAKKLGLWKQANPEPPWEWRAARKKAKNKNNGWFSML